MTKYGGFLFTCDENTDDIAALRASITINHTCSVVMNNPELIQGKLEICVFSWDNKHIDYLALMRRSRAAATARYTLKFLRLVKLDSISIQEIEKAISHEIKSYILRTSSRSGKRIPPNLWLILIDNIKQKQSDKVKDIDELEKLRQLSEQRFTSAGYNIVKQEKDATLLALKLFGADYDDVLFSWISRSSDPTSYLAGFEGIYTHREDDAIIRDISTTAEIIAPDFPIRQLFTDERGWLYVPRKDGKHLLVINANRNKIESTSGVDLIYYDLTYQTYILIQYKMMTRSGPYGEFAYHPDSDFYCQMKRMRKIEENAKKKAIEAKNTIAIDTFNDRIDIKEYRLHSELFYYKFCESVTLKPSQKPPEASSSGSVFESSSEAFSNDDLEKASFKPFSPELFEGIYLPLDFVESLLKGAQLQTINSDEESIKKITYRTVDRHFPNTTFIKLVQEGMIGARSNMSKHMHEIIEQAQINNRSIITALAGL